TLPNGKRFKLFGTPQLGGPESDRQRNGVQQPRRRRTTVLPHLRDRANTPRLLHFADREEKSTHDFQFGSLLRSYPLRRLESRLFALLGEAGAKAGMNSS